MDHLISVSILLTESKSWVHLILRWLPLWSQWICHHCTQGLFMLHMELDHLCQWVRAYHVTVHQEEHFRTVLQHFRCLTEDRSQCCSVSFLLCRADLYIKGHELDYKVKIMFNLFDKRQVVIRVIGPM